MTVSRSRRRLLGAAAAVLAVAALAAYLLLAGGESDDGTLVVADGPLPTVDPRGVELDTGPPPWDPPARAEGYIDAAGLVALPKETLDVHYHAHLDVIVDGKPLVVPSGIGYVVSGEAVVAISPLHTHDIDGVVHVESPTNVPYTLAQFFTQWGVRFDPDCVGGLCSDGRKEWRLYIDGEQRMDDRTTVVLRPHQEIALWYGEVDADADVPSSYEFAPGE